MKKMVLKILLSFCMAVVVMGGCGSDTEATLADGTVTIGEDQTTEGTPEKPIEESAENVTEESKEEPIEESAKEPVEEPAKDWFEEQELVITPQGDFTFTAMAYDDSKNDADTFEVIADAVIIETTDGVEDGYKEIAIVWNMDMSPIVGLGFRGFRFNSLAFDRYTGIAFVFDSSVTTTNLGETSHKEGFVTIVNGDESYDVSVTNESVNNYPYITSTMTVICPVDYDGVVFQIGYDDLELREANQAIDYTARLYTLDELPYFGEGYYYFSYSNK